MLGMMPLPTFDLFPGGAQSGSGQSGCADGPLASEEESTMLKTLGWISAALGAVAIGLVIGREIRHRYKFNRRTPYDLYAHSGDEMQDVEFGVGI
jgi:hypothetical protein